MAGTPQGKNNAFPFQDELLGPVIGRGTTKAAGTIGYTLANLPSAGEVVVIGDGLHTVTFEFQDLAAGVPALGSNSGGVVLIDLDVVGGDFRLAKQIAEAINASPLRIIATPYDTTGGGMEWVVTLVNDIPGEDGNVTITTTASKLAVAGMTGGA